MKKLIALIFFFFLFTDNVFSQTVSSGGSLTAISNLRQGTTLLNSVNTSGVNTAQTITLTGAVGQQVTLRGLFLDATGAAATSTVTVSDGATQIINFGTVSVALLGLTTLLPGNAIITGTPGNSITINVGAGGAAAVTVVSVIADRQ